jgi:hypothetical protein
VFYEVTKLRRNAVRLRPEEWPMPEFGFITMSTWKPGRTPLMRTARVATHHQPADVLDRRVIILIEPRITHLPVDGEVWLGTELHTTERGIEEVEQAWLVRPTTKNSDPLPPFDVKRWMETRRTYDPPEPPVGIGWLKPQRQSERR